MYKFLLFLADDKKEASTNATESTESKAVLKKRSITYKRSCVRKTQ